MATIIVLWRTPAGTTPWHAALVPAPARLLAGTGCSARSHSPLGLGVALAVGKAGMVVLLYLVATGAMYICTAGMYLCTVIYIPRLLRLLGVLAMLGVWTPKTRYAAHVCSWALDPKIAASRA